MSQTYVVSTAHPTGTTRLKLWAFRTLKNTISNILSDRFTHIFSRVEPLLERLLPFTFYLLPSLPVPQSPSPPISHHSPS